MGRLAPWKGQVESPVLIPSRLLLFFTKGALKMYFKEPEPLYYCSLSQLRLSSLLQIQVYTVPEAVVTASLLRTLRCNCHFRPFWKLSMAALLSGAHSACRTR